MPLPMFSLPQQPINSKEHNHFDKTAMCHAENALVCHILVLCQVVRAVTMRGCMHHARAGQHGCPCLWSCARSCLTSSTARLHQSPSMGANAAPYCIGTVAALPPADARYTA
ncbi:hypothetical protein ABBQ38_15542 [Trebouxia sp. C0009 RCD-2024]